MSTKESRQWWLIQDKEKVQRKLLQLQKEGLCAKDYWSKRKFEDSNAATSNQKKDSDKEWEAGAYVTIKKEKLALTVIIHGHINYDNYWIINSWCLNNMIGDREKLQDMIKYKGGRMVVTTNNSWLSIAHIGNIILTSR